MSRCTKMGAGGNMITNANNYNFNKYTGGGIGTSSISVRNAKLRLNPDFVPISVLLAQPASTSSSTNLSSL